MESIKYSICITRRSTVARDLEFTSFRGLFIDFTVLTKWESNFQKLGVYSVLLSLYTCSLTRTILKPTALWRLSYVRSVFISCETIKSDCFTFECSSPFPPSRRMLLKYHARWKSVPVSVYHVSKANLGVVWSSTDSQPLILGRRNYQWHDTLSPQGSPPGGRIAVCTVSCNFVGRKTSRQFPLGRKYQAAAM